MMSVPELCFRQRELRGFGSAGFGRKRLLCRSRCSDSCQRRVLLSALVLSSFWTLPCCIEIVIIALGPRKPLLGSGAILPGRRRRRRLEASGTVCASEHLLPLFSSSLFGNRQEKHFSSLKCCEQTLLQ